MFFSKSSATFENNRQSRASLSTTKVWKSNKQTYLCFSVKYIQTWNLIMTLKSLIIKWRTDWFKYAGNEARLFIRFLYIGNRMSICRCVYLYRRISVIAEPIWLSFKINVLICPGKIYSYIREGYFHPKKNIPPPSIFFKLNKFFLET